MFALFSHMTKAGSFAFVTGVCSLQVLPAENDSPKVKKVLFRYKLCINALKGGFLYKQIF